MRTRPRPRTALLLAAAALLLPAAATPLAGAAPTAGPAAPASTATASAAGPGTVVLDWERVAMRTVYTEAATPIPVGIPYLGFTSVAMHRAARWADHRDASGPAAVAVAAHGVLAAYFPASRAALDAALATSLASVPPGSDRTGGMHVGADAARRMVSERADDGRGDATVVYDVPAGPGVWQPAPGTTMLAPWLGSVDPLLSDRPIRVDGPDGLRSWAYAMDYLEVMRTGGATGADRTARQTETVGFFTANAATMVGEALVEHLAAEPMSLRRTTGLFAAMHGAMTDAIITCWRLKRDVGFWRPVEAIRGAASDGNPATVPDPAWTPLLPTPPYSDYVSGHGCVTSPATEVIRRVLGEETSLTLRTPTLSRTYPTLSAIEHDAFNARIWGGLHFRDAMEDAYSIGHQAARNALHALGAHHRR
ncbi:vanadium-dependent haloperoxidase [Nocardioides abyssi]|uniref:Vanadium-dependent haloperoxidase n=1 Tax=Nocardioides abyssi TaxID=3058370 RepID=A0ABT8ERR4_9ACTN|nr:vanadium-dependent haloperoxidase [Nocardioides abyssi]MDN4160838.1 vanadium-dependent haloperoxidase [Nocardioides abyssi]